jgi:MinD-like ATPase involved in chromosome partitioning or flagellar assembly
LASDNQDRAAGTQQDRPAPAADPAADAAEPSASAGGAAAPGSRGPAQQQAAAKAAASSRAAGAHRLGQPASAPGQDPRAADAQRQAADAAGPADSYGPPDGYGAAGPYGAPDSYGQPQAAATPDSYGQPGTAAAADPYGQADPYSLPDPYADMGGDDSAYPYGGYAIGDDPFRGVAHYGPPEGYSPADPYGPPDDYQPADPFRPPEPYPGPGQQPPAADYPAANPAAPPAAAGRPDVAAPQDAAVPPTARPGSPEDAGGYVPPPFPGVAAAPDAASRPPASGPEADEQPEGLEFLLPARRRAPSPGWRRVVFHASGGMLRVPASAAELRRRDMISRVRTPVAGGHHRVAVMSLKGGVGKTTTTVGLGSTLASLRGDRVIAVDANPDRGTLSDKVRLETAATVRDLLNERRHISRYADVRSFTSQAASRLEVLASDRDPTVSVAFGDDDYCQVARVLEHYYSICLTDCGTGLLHSAMGGVLRLADQIVLVSTPSVDGARSASATLDWLAAHSYGDLVRNAVVVLSAVRPRSRSTVDLNRLEEHFAARCRAVTRIPYDSYLEEGAEVELEQLSRATADAYLALAALIGDGLAWPRKAAARAQPASAAGGGQLGG